MKTLKEATFGLTIWMLRLIAIIVILMAAIVIAIDAWITPLGLECLSWDIIDPAELGFVLIMLGAACGLCVITDWEDYKHGQRTGKMV